MKNVLFVSTMDYKFNVDNATLEKKFRGLAKGMNVFVLARGQEWEIERFGAKFYLTPKWGTIPFMFVTFFRAWRILYKEKIDTIITQSPLFDGLVGAKLKIFTGKELIIEVHSDWINSLFFQHKVPLAGLAKWLFIRIGRFSLRRADKVRVISTATEKLVRDNSRHTDFYRFPTFTDIDMFKAETDVSYEPFIMYAGWLYYLKGLHLLIEAFGRIQDKYPNFKLLIVGDGPYKQELLGCAKKFKVERIEFTGWKPLEEVKDLMKRCYCFALCSYSEGLGRVLIEAAMLKKPSVGSRVDGIPDIIKDGETGYLFTSGSVDELTAKLDALLSDPDRARAMGEAGRRFVEDRFSTEKYFEDYIKMVDD